MNQPDKHRPWVDRPDVLVVGAGVVGLFCAYFLQQAGFRVVVVDRSAPEQRCSWGNAGLLVPSHFIPLPAPGAIAQALRWSFSPHSPFYVPPRWDPALWRWLWLFGQYCTPHWVHRHSPLLLKALQRSLHLYRDLHEKGILRCGFQQKGLLQLYHTNRIRREMQHREAFARQLGLSATLIEPLSAGRCWHESLAALGCTARGGLYFPDDAHLNPGQLLNQLTLLVREKAGEVIEDCTVYSLSARGDFVREVETSAGVFRPGQVLLAAGAWTPLLLRPLGVDLPLQPARGYSITFPSGNFPLQVPAILEEEKVAVTALGNHLRLAGTLEFSGWRSCIRLARVQAIAQAFRKRFPDYRLPPAREWKVWAGLRPCLPDGLPTLGPVPGLNNLWLATGHAMLGISLAPFSGEWIARRMQREIHEEAGNPFCLTRFGSAEGEQ